MAKALSVIKPTGCYSHIANAGTDRAALQRLQDAAAAGKGPRASLTLVTPNGGQLAELLALVAAGQLRLEVARVSAGGFGGGGRAHSHARTCEPPCASQALAHVCAAPAWLPAAGAAAVAGGRGSQAGGGRPHARQGGAAGAVMATRGARESRQL